jgi:hypothetical protein
MTVFVCTLVPAVFLSGGVAGIFGGEANGIRIGDRARCLAESAARDLHRGHPIWSARDKRAAQFSQTALQVITLATRRPETTSRTERAAGRPDLETARP